MPEKLKKTDDEIFEENILKLRHEYELDQKSTNKKLSNLLRNKLNSAQAWALTCISSSKGAL